MSDLAARGFPSRSATLRHLRAGIFWAFCAVALAIIIAPCIAIVGSLIVQAAPVLRPSLFTNTTLAASVDYTNLATVGLLNGLLGTLYMSVGVLIVAGPIGILGGLYVAEFAPPRLRAVVRFFSEVLSGVPSIIVGYVGYTALVVGLHWGYSLLGAVLALSAIILPYIVKTTEVAFEHVPRSLREGAAALGLSRGHTIRSVLLPPALPGVVSGLVISLAISMGETAPLLFTANWWDQNPKLALLHQPFPYLTGVTFNGIQLPYPDEHELAAAAALVTVLLVLAFILIGRAITARSRRMTARLDL